MSTAQKIQKRQVFLNTCHESTQAIHTPLIDLTKTEGRLNPAGLGNVATFSGHADGQSTVGFDLTADYYSADKAGHSLYGGAEYAVVQSTEAAAVCEKFVKLHGGAGAIVAISGLAAFSAVFLTFLKNEDAPLAVLLPDNRYFPAERLLSYLKNIHPQLHIHHYQPNSDGAQMETLCQTIEQSGQKIALLYIESPGSQTFEIADIDGLVAVAKKRQIRTIMDNTWSSHVRFRPIAAAGIDIVIQATTKYESGYADTPSGIVIARTEDDFKALSRTQRIFGLGTVAPQICSRLLHRVDSTAERMDRHYKMALDVTDWFRQQTFLDHIICPFLPESPDYARFQKYFKKGNGLFTVVLRPEITSEQIDSFIDRLLLFRIGESWGGHVSLALPAHPGRKLTSLPAGKMIRFSMGLEDSGDLIRDLAQAAHF